MSVTRRSLNHFNHRAGLCLALTSLSIGCADDQGPSAPGGLATQGEQPAAPGPGASPSSPPSTPGAQPPPADLARDAGAGGGDAGAAVPSDAAAAPMYEAVQAIRDAFRDNAYDSYAPLAKGIDAAAKSYPDDPTIARYAAVLRLWRLSESARDPAFSLLDAAPVLLEAQARFETARKLAPSDGRLAGWSAAMTLRAGQALGSAAQIEAGKRELEASIAAYPAFNLFVQGSALSALPRTDPDFAAAVDKIYTMLEGCGYTLDRANPVLPADATPTAEGACVNSSYAPHNIEGLFLTFGDAMTKAGETELAKVLYGNAKARPSYATWPYRARLEERIANVEKNAASFEDDDPANDFKVALEDGHYCVTCHATKP